MRRKAWLLRPRSGGQLTSPTSANGGDVLGGRTGLDLLRLWLTAHAFASVEETLRGGIPPKKHDSAS